MFFKKFEQYNFFSSFIRFMLNRLLLPYKRVFLVEIFLPLKKSTAATNSCEKIVLNFTSVGAVFCHYFGIDRNIVYNCGLISCACKL